MKMEPVRNNIVARAAKIPGWMLICELNWLYDQAASLSITKNIPHPQILEIGCFKGRSAYVLCGAGLEPSARPPDYSPPQHVTLVDHFKGADVEVEDNNIYFQQFQHESGRKLAVEELRTNLRVWENWTLYQESSDEFFNRKYLSPEGVPQNKLLFDMAFVDASHDEKSATNDINGILKLLAPGGIACGHDYKQRPGVTKAVDKVFGALGVVVHRGANTIWYCYPKV